jgi:hypothetical protein
MIELLMCQQAIQSAVHIWDGLNKQKRAGLDPCNRVSGQQMLAGAISQTKMLTKRYFPTDQPMPTQPHYSVPKHPKFSCNRQEFKKKCTVFMKLLKK